VQSQVEAYADFVRNKSQLDGRYGFKPTFHHPKAKDFQSSLVEFAVEQGMAALFEDCGLGKSLQEMIWAENVIRHTNKPVLLLSPLMVSMQMVEEAEKFDFDAERSRDGTMKPGARIVLTNYEQLHKFDPVDFAGVVCDESSCIKNFEGSRKAEITEFMRMVKYRLLCSATPSPNDYIELGTSSEALGQLGYMDMLGMFFKNDEDSLHPMFMGSKWRFKHHAEQDFWRWVCSWARAIRKPSDIGFSDDGYVLPELIEQEHVLESPPRPGMMFSVPAKGLAEEREERRATIIARCEKAAELLSTSDCGVAWCQLNAEADALVAAIDGAEQIKGSDSDERKEELLIAFKSGQLGKLVTKYKITSLGLNWQHCSHMTDFPDHSFEQYYQSVRRLWRFGQKNAVRVDSVTTEGLAGVVKNRKRKSAAADEMFKVMIEQMNDALGLKRFHEHTSEQEIPKWL
jgi:hypothetical protein